MVQGQSSRDTVQWEILEFLYDNGPATSVEIMKNTDCAKATFYKYLDELIEDERRKVNWIPRRGKGNHLYELSTKAKKWVKAEKYRRRLRKNVDDLPLNEEEGGGLGLSEGDQASLLSLLEAFQQGRVHIS